MGAALVVGQLVLRKNLIKSLMGGQVQLPDHAWKHLELGLERLFCGHGRLESGLPTTLIPTPG